MDRGRGRGWQSPGWALLCALLAGCTPKIGDKCQLSTDCSQLGDRLCDTTQPDGYCTIFNCEPDNCPDAVCVAFDPELDPACGTADDSRWPRFERSFCERPCDDDGDCREQYFCVDLNKPGDGRPDTAEGKLLRAYEEELAKIALIVDREPTSTKVCLVRPDGQTASPNTSGSTPGVCTSTDGGVPWPDGGLGGTGGAGGSGGTGGT
jgi:hypothetical protein